MRSGGKPLGLTSFGTLEMPYHLWRSQSLICIMGIILLTQQGKKGLIDEPRAGRVHGGSGVPSYQLSRTLFFCPPATLACPVQNAGSRIGPFLRALVGREGTVP